MRLMTEIDLDRVLVLEQSLHATPWTRGNFCDALGSGYLCFVKQVDREIAGYAVLMPGVDEAELLNIGVAYEYQHQGLGRYMLEALLLAAREKKLSPVYLEVRASNFPAIALYQRAGFSQIGLRRGYYQIDTGREDALVMVRDNLAGSING